MTATSLRRASRTLVLGLVAAALIAVAPSSAAAVTTHSWNGANPFKCDVQYAGRNAAPPVTNADPYCLEFDKRNQNVIPNLGLVDFLLLEPERIARALDKCFYYQIDHWRASLIQGFGFTQWYNWDGRYFIDQARGEVGVYMTNLLFGPTPSLLKPLTYGVRIKGVIPVNPRCAARAAAEGSSIYR